MIKSETARMSALGDFIDEFCRANNLSNERLAARAKKHQVSGETIRKARNDLYKGPLPPETVEQLADALRISATKVRDLDNLRWKPGPVTPRDIELSDEQIKDILRRRLPGRDGEHIANQFGILADYLDASLDEETQTRATSPPSPPPLPGRGSRVTSPARATQTPDVGPSKT